MGEISIPALGIATSIVMGTHPYTDARHVQEANAILSRGAYQYKDLPIYGAHSDQAGRIFEKLPQIKKGAEVHIDGKKYKVTQTKVVKDTAQWILRRKTPALFTCVNNGKDRFAAFLQPVGD